MKWTAEKLGEMRSLAAEGRYQREAAALMGVPYHSLKKAAQRYRVSFDHNQPPSDEQLRARWESILPALKDSLRRDIQRVQA